MARIFDHLENQIGSLFLTIEMVVKGHLFYHGLLKIGEPVSASAGMHLNMTANMF